MDAVQARLKQLQFVEIFGGVDWDVYRKRERKLLYDKVGLAMFGLPQTGYEKEQVDSIKKVTDIIIREDVHGGGDSEDTWMSIIILLVKPLKQNSDLYCHPVFRVPKYTGRVCNRHAFVDCFGRVYGNWHDFMENNKLPQSEVCYPLNGVYRHDNSGRALVDFCRTKSNVLSDAVDMVSNVVGYGSLLVAHADFAPLATAALVGSFVSGVCRALRAMQDQVDRKRHGQSVGLGDINSVWNWASIIKGLYCFDLLKLNSANVTEPKSMWRYDYDKNYEYINAIQEVQPSSILSACSKWGIIIRTALYIRPPTTALEMLSNVRAKNMLTQDVLLFCHTVVDGKYVADFLRPEEQQILDLKSKILETIPSCGGVGDDKVRYLDYVGFKDKIPPQIFELGIYGNVCKFQLSFPCDVQMFGKIEGCVHECIDSALAGKWIRDLLLDIKASIDFFSNYDLQWAIKVTKNISKIICQKVEAFSGIISGFYSFMENVIELACKKTTTLYSQLKLTPGDVVEIVKICIDKQQNFYNKFAKLCQNYILPRLGNFAVSTSTHNVRRRIVRTHAQNIINPPLKNVEIFYAASEAVGSVLNTSNAKIVKADDGEMFVIITDTKIETSLVQITWDVEKGNVNATVVNKTRDDVSNTGKQQRI